MRNRFNLKLTGEALKFFQEVGSVGGKERAKKYSTEQLSRWGKLGGRPHKEKKAQPGAAAKPVPMPNGEALLLPVLKLLADGLEHSSQEIRERLRVQFKIASNELIQRLENGKTAFDSNIDLALAYLQGAPQGRSKAINRVSEKVYRITNHGNAILRRNPSALTIKDLQSWS